MYPNTNLNYFYFLFRFQEYQAKYIKMNKTRHAIFSDLNHEKREKRERGRKRTFLMYIGYECFFRLSNRGKKLIESKGREEKKANRVS